MHTQREGNIMYGKNLISRIDEVSSVYREGIYIATENPFSNEEKFLIKVGNFLFVKHSIGSECSIFSCNTPVTVLISINTVSEVIDKKMVDVTYFKIEFKVKDLRDAEAKKIIITDLLLNSFNDDTFFKNMLNRKAIECLSGVFI